MPRFAAASLVTLLAAACGPSIDFEDVPAEFASATCEQIETCAGVFAEVVGISDCQGAFEGAARNTTYEALGALIDRGTISYDGGKAAECFEALRAEGCSILIAAPPPVCRQIFNGSVAIGGPCSVSEECEGDAYCDGAACPSSEGTCAARKANGAACGATDECGDSLVCEGGSCGPPSSRSGGACEGGTGQTCPIDELCIGAASGVAGTCTPITSLMTAAETESCRIGQDVDPILCQAGLSCAVTGFDLAGPTFECLAPVGAGAACNLSVPDMCPDGQYCDAQPMLLMFDGTCVPLPTVGQACAARLVGAPCAAGLVCDGVGAPGTCVQPQDNGAACETGAGCYSGRCLDGACAGPELCGG